MRLGKKARGLALGTIMICMVVFSLILLTAVSASVSHLKLVESSTRQEHARNLAEAALNKALSMVIESNYKFGSNGTDRVDVTVAGLEDASGVVSFRSGDLPSGYSTFNLEGDSAKAGVGGRQVPPRTIHLVARGTVGSAERWMECVYYKPPFPDGLAATGPVEASALYLAGVKSTQAYVNSGSGANPIPPEDALPANLFSNSQEGFTPSSAAAVLGQDCTIKGSAGAVGLVSVDPTSVVEGEVLPGSQPRPMPEIDIQGKVEVIEKNSLEVSSGGSLKLSEQWFSLCKSNLEVNGDLDLNGSALAVKGNLLVTGAIRGTGVILVTGDTEIRDGRSSVTANDQVAIGCMGDFKLRADAPANNFFQGLVYCEGNLEAKDITVLGATVANGKRGAKGSVKLDNVRMIATPGSVVTAVRQPEGTTIRNGQYWATNIVLRRKADNSGYLADVHATFCDYENLDKNKNNKLDDPDPYKDVSVVWKDHPDGFSDHYLEFKLLGKDIGELDPGLMETNIAKPFTDELLKGLAGGVFGGKWKPGELETAKAAIKLQVEKTAKGDAYSISFNLNNLLREVMGSSRVVLWRPFKPPTS